MKRDPLMRTSRKLNALECIALSSPQPANRWEPGSKMAAVGGWGGCWDAGAGHEGGVWSGVRLFYVPYEPQRVLADVDEAPQRFHRFLGRRGCVGELKERTERTHTLKKKTVIYSFKRVL